MQSAKRDLDLSGKSNSLLPWPHRLSLVFIIAFWALSLQSFSLPVLSEKKPTIPIAAKRAAATITAKELKDEHIAYLASDKLEGRAAGSAGGKKAGKYIAKEFKACGLKPVGDNGTYFQNFSAKGRSMRNVVGYLEGSDPVLKDELIIVGAHYDHIGRRKGKIHNGADDNASGTAGVLEIAEAFASLPGNPKRSILFICFDGEEIGLCGSSHYVRNPIFPLEKGKLMINFDMIGRYRNVKLVIFGVGSSPGFEDLLKSLNEYADCQLKLILKNGRGYATDHWPFTSKMPYLWFYTQVHSNMHTPTDDVGRINGPGVDKCATLAFLFIYEVSGGVSGVKKRGSACDMKRVRRVSICTACGKTLLGYRCSECEKKFALDEGAEIKCPKCGSEKSFPTNLVKENKCFFCNGPIKWEIKCVKRVYACPNHPEDIPLGPGRCRECFEKLKLKKTVLSKTIAYYECRKCGHTQDSSGKCPDCKKTLKRKRKCEMSGTFPHVNELEWKKQHK